MPCDIVLYVRRAWAIAAIAAVSLATGAAAHAEMSAPSQLVTRRYEVQVDPATGRLVRAAVRGKSSLKSALVRPLEAGPGNQVVQGESASPARQKIAGLVDIDSLVRRESRRSNVDPALVHAVIRQESGYDPFAVSVKGAKGLMQLMPETARQLGVKDVFDPAENVRGGVKLLRELIDRYDGDRRLALAAYNAGEGAVERYGGVPPYPETRDYISRIESRYRPKGDLASDEARIEDARPQRIQARLNDSGVLVFEAKSD